MNFRTKIKFGNITNLSDARFAAAAGFDYIGFCFDSSDINCIAPIKAQQIIEWTQGNLIVAEFGNQTIDVIGSICDLLKMDMIEVNNDLLPDEIAQLEKPVIKKIDLTRFNSEGLKKEIEAYKNVVYAFHVFSSNKAQNVDSKDMIKLFDEQKIIWGLPIDSSTVNQIIESLKPYAFNISGGDEEKPGYKDFEELNDLLEKITLES